MKYRAGTEADWPKIAEFVKRVGQFNSVHPPTLGGSWLLAIDGAGEIHGTIWCFYQVPHAYVDYWVGGGKTAARLAMIAEYQLRALGIRYLRGVVLERNTSAHRLLTEGHGMLSGPNYYLVFKELTDGRLFVPGDDTDNDDTGSRRAGAGASQVAVGAGS